jgi:hypothetical protein
MSLRVQRDACLGPQLKALDMAAAGLPVVASLMRPLHDVAGAVALEGSRSAKRPNKYVELMTMTLYSTAWRRVPTLRIRDRACQPADLVALAKRIGIGN